MSELLQVRSSTAGPTVLLVEDVRAVRDHLERRIRLSTPRAQILVADSAEQAIEIVRSVPVDIIVADFRLPGEDGISFLTTAREIAPDVPRVLLTGYTDGRVAVRAVNEAQVQAFFEKPAVGEDFERQTSRLMDEHWRNRSWPE